MSVTKICRTFCENNGRSCQYCFHLDMLWYKDQETSEILHKKMKEIHDIFHKGEG